MRPIMRHYSEEDAASVQDCEFILGVVVNVLRHALVKYRKFGGVGWIPGSTSNLVVFVGNRLTVTGTADFRAERSTPAPSHSPG